MEFCKFWSIKSILEGSLLMVLQLALLTPSPLLFSLMPDLLQSCLWLDT